MFITGAMSSSSSFNNNITKVIMTIFLVLSLSIVTYTMIRNNDGDYESSFVVFAQMEKDRDTNQKMNLHTQSVVNNNSTNNRNTTFSAIGTISSLVITVPENEFNITNAFKVILTGDWILNVHNGTVTKFASKLVTVPLWTFKIQSPVNITLNAFVILNSSSGTDITKELIVPIAEKVVSLLLVLLLFTTDLVCRFIF